MDIFMLHVNENYGHISVSYNYEYTSVLCKWKLWIYFCCMLMEIMDILLFHVNGNYGHISVSCKRKLWTYFCFM